MDAAVEVREAAIGGEAAAAAEEAVCAATTSIYASDGLEIIHLNSILSLIGTNYIL